MGFRPNFRRRHALVSVALSPLCLASRQAAATVLMDLNQAQKLLLPDASQFVPWPIKIDETKLAGLIESKLPRSFAPVCFQATDNDKLRGWVITDRVIGKYEWIDYAAGFRPDGSVCGIEIMSYRESHGGEIRNRQWRQQFVGRQGPQQIRFGDEIKNISGATLSCQHVSEGVQRLSALVKLSLVS